MIPVSVVGSAYEVGERVVDRIEALFATNDVVVLGCPAGRTPIPLYRSLARRAVTRRLDLSRLRIVMMDEYVEHDGERLRWVPQSAPHSCRGFAERELRAVLNAGLPCERRLAAEHVYTPDPSDPEAFENLIDALAGIDLFVLALGATDGHVAFNPPGSRATSRTRIVELSEATRGDNLVTFPTFGTLDAVPRYGVSVGLSTIAAKSEAVVLIAHGKDKADAVAHTLALEGFDPAWPASVIYNCASPQILIDTAAAS